MPRPPGGGIMPCGRPPGGRGIPGMGGIPGIPNGGGGTPRWEWVLVFVWDWKGKLERTSWERKWWWGVHAWVLAEHGVG